MPYNKMRLAVGFFILTIVISMGLSLFLLVKEKGIFDKRYSYGFNMESAEFFSVGMPIKFSGFNIGVIDDISLIDNGRVDMTFSVDEHNKKWMTKDSVLMIKKPLIGSPHVVLYSALGNDALEVGTMMQIISSDDINDMIAKLEPVVNNITGIIDNISTLTAKISSDDSAIFKTLNNIETLTAKLAKNDSLLTSLTGDKASTASLVNSINQVEPMMREFVTISKEMTKLTASIDKDLMKPTSATIKELEGIMKDVKQKLDALDGTVKAVGSYDKDLSNLKEQISVSIAKSNKIMDKVDAIMQDSDATEVIIP